MTAARLIPVALIVLAALQPAYADNKKGGGGAATGTTTKTPSPSGPVPVPYPNATKSIMKKNNDTSKNSISNVK